MQWEGPIESGWGCAVQSGRRGDQHHHHHHHHGACCLQVEHDRLKRRRVFLMMNFCTFPGFCCYFAGSRDKLNSWLTCFRPGRCDPVVGFIVQKSPVLLELFSSDEQTYEVKFVHNSRILFRVTNKKLDSGFVWWGSSSTSAAKSKIGGGSHCSMVESGQRVWRELVLLAGLGK